MRRFLFLLGLVVICIGSFLLYQHQLQQRAADSKQMFEVVMAEKMRHHYCTYSTVYCTVQYLRRHNGRTGWSERWTNNRESDRGWRWES